MRGRKSCSSTGLRLLAFANSTLEFVLAVSRHIPHTPPCLRRQRWLLEGSVCCMDPVCSRIMQMWLTQYIYLYGCLCQLIDAQAGGVGLGELQ